MTTPTTVSVQNTPGSYYTWAGSNWTWTDARAQKSWNTSYDSSYVVSATEGWQNSDSLGNVTTKPLNDGWSTAEYAARNLNKNPQEGWSTSEGLANSTVKPVSEGWSNKETYGNNITKPAAEGFTTVELGVTRQFTKNSIGLIATAEVLGNSTNKPISEGWATSDSYGNQLAKAVSELFNTIDGYLTKFGKGIPESWKTAEHYTDVMAWTLRAIEYIRTSEQLGNQVGRPFTESFSATDSYLNEYSLQPKEALALAESIVKAINRPFAESFNTGESTGNATSKPFPEQFQTSELIIKEAVVGINEAIATAELFGRAIVYIRLLSDGFSTSDALARATTISKSEAFHTMEEYRRHGNGVMSNIQITTDALDESTFTQLLASTSPPGYSNFKTFITGSYTYQRALFRSVVQSLTLDRAAIVDTSVAVDIQEVNDSGQAVITNAATGVAVTYNRPFHITPEVTLSLKGGTDALAIPRFSVAPNNTGFTVMLVDPINGSAVTGTVSWAAHGY